jgi:hypothetical protein
VENYVAYSNNSLRTIRGNTLEEGAEKSKNYYENKQALATLTQFTATLTQSSAILTQFSATMTTILG